MDEPSPLVPKPKPPQDATTAPAPITAANYDARALQFAQACGLAEWPTIKPGTPEWAAWQDYFDRRLGGRPWMFNAVAFGQKQTMTVPAQWPEWFDRAYAASGAC